MIEMKESENLSENIKRMLSCLSEMTVDGMTLLSAIVSCISAVIAFFICIISLSPGLGFVAAFLIGLGMAALMFGLVYLIDRIRKSCKKKNKRQEL